MKPTIIKTACAILFGSALVAGAEDGVAQERVFGNGVLSEHLSMYDVNDDGGLSTEEYQALKDDRANQARHQRFRSRWDTNRDGRIDAREHAHAVNQIKKVIERRRLRRFAEVDSNSDENLSLDEFFTINAVNATNLVEPGTAEKIFNHLDHDGNALISQREFLQSLDSVRPVPVEANNSKPRPTIDNSPVPVAPVRPAN